MKQFKTNPEQANLEISLCISADSHFTTWGWRRTEGWVDECDDTHTCVWYHVCSVWEMSESQLEVLPAVCSGYAKYFKTLMTDFVFLKEAWQGCLQGFVHLTNRMQKRVVFQRNYCGNYWYVAALWTWEGIGGRHICSPLNLLFSFLYTTLLR